IYGCPTPVLPSVEKRITVNLHIHLCKSRCRRGKTQSGKKISKSSHSNHSKVLYRCRQDSDVAQGTRQEGGTALPFRVPVCNPSLAPAYAHIASVAWNP